MTFHEKQFPTDISVGSVGGPGWKTDVIVFDSGGEQRNQRWSELRAEYEAAYGVREIEQLHALVEFFNECRGRLHGFRYKDFLDYSVTNEPIVANGGPTLQLMRTYGTGINDYEKDIKKPVSGTVTLRNSTVTISGTTVDTTTGVVTFIPDSVRPITNISNANPGVVSSTSHGLSTGQEIYITDVVGMTEVNNTVYTVTVISPSSYSIDVDTTTYGTYSSGGNGGFYPQSGDTVDWSGEYDTPCRFDTDKLAINLSTYNTGGTSVPIVELKL